MESNDLNSTPRWSSSTKIVITFVLVAVVAFLIYKFKYILGPLLFAFFLAYLLHPVALFLHKKAHFPWRLAATLIYLLLFLVLIGLLTWGGISLVEPLQNLTVFLQKLVNDLPTFLADLSSQPLMIGTFAIDLSQFKITDLFTQLQGVLSPLLSNLGTILGNIASGAASTITWTFFTILIAYFIDVESEGLRSNMIKLRVPGYQEDISRMGKHLGRIWNAYLRGQLSVLVITIVVYSVLLTAMGVRYSLGLALLAGLARFVPYVGPFVAWTTYGLVALFQGTTMFNLLPLPYALVIIGIALITDVIIDNFVSPRIMSDSLNVHPAGVLVMVLVMANLVGFIGVLLSAPLLASFQLIFNYVIRKLMDLDPWENMPADTAEVAAGGISFIGIKTGIINLWKKTVAFFSNVFKKSK
ncbi:MAG: AI-2E family transporter [Anaerolineaceae bacterium]|nr:AI-2E family transporter [Anaerolineaceae bacterium]